MKAAVDRRRIEDFIYHEARLLDERRFEDWMALFRPDGVYWAPARPEQADPWSEVSLMFDDKELMSNRIQRLRHPKMFAQLPASRAVRQVSNIRVDESPEAQAKPDGIVTVRSVFFMFEHRPTLPQPMERVLAGHYTHELVPHGETFEIASKKALLANCDAAFDSFFLYF